MKEISKQKSNLEEVIMVKAIEVGHFGHLREKGDVFELRAVERINPETKQKYMVPAEQQFSAKWMKKLSDREMKKFEEAKEEAEDAKADNSLDSGVI